jgi:predicted component of type VI protein secretion system
MQSNESSQTAKKRRVSRKEQERQEAVTELRKYLKSGTTVFTILRRVSSTGMSRLIDIHVIVDNEPLRFTWSAATALGLTYDRKREALRIDGCGMDVGFDVTYRLSYLLHGDGYSLKHRWL